MQTRSRLNAVLLLLLLGSVLWIVLQPRQLATTPVPLGSVRPDTISYIRIEPARQQALEFRRGVHWKMISPVATYANMDRIDAITGLLASRSYHRLERSAIAELAEVGLETPSLVLHLNDLQFSFGTTDPVNAYRYVRWQDEIHLIQDGLFPQLQQSAMFFISRRLLPPDAVINTLAVRGVTLVRHNGSWQASAATALNGRQLQAYIDRWTSAEAVSVSRQLESAGQDNVTITLVDGTVIRFFLHRYRDQMQLVRRDLGILYTLDEPLSGSLFSLGGQPDA